MPSSRFIIQQFNASVNVSNPHANHSNTTLTRLRNTLAERNDSNNQSPTNVTPLADKPAKTNPAYKDTITAPNENVYQISGDIKDDVEVLMKKLLALNFSQGGNCAAPSLSMTYNINRLHHSETNSQRVMDKLSLQACGPVLIPTFMLQLLGNVTESLGVLPPSTPSSNSDHHVLIIALALSLFIGSSLFLAAVERSRVKEEERTGADADHRANGYKPVSMR
jgi:hypothetical protein